MINIKRVFKVAFFTILPCWVLLLSFFVYEHDQNLFALQTLSEVNNSFILQHVRWSKEQSVGVTKQLQDISDKLDRLK